jgi:hypothetical protein
MLKVKVTKSFDWIRIAVTDENKKKLSLTLSRYRDSCSGSVPIEMMELAIRAFAKIRDKKDDKTFEQKLEDLEKIANASPSIDAYVTAMQELAAA